MAIPGERFVLDLSDDEGDQPVDQQPHAAPLIDLIGEIKERTPKAATPPTPKTLTGFPASKDRRGRSAFKQRRAANHNAAASVASHPRPAATSTPQELNAVDEEKRIIDEENKQRLAAMSDAEIESERAELMSNLSPSLLERLLRRANNVDKPTNSGQQDSAVLPSKRADTAENKTKSTTKSVSFNLTESVKEKPTKFSRPNEKSVLDNREEVPVADESTDIDERAPAVHPPDLRPASEFPTGPIHFPTPPPRQGPVPDLDPNSPSFYADLKTHYFPEITHDPSALSWFKSDESDKGDHATTSPYHPSSSATSIVPSALRFSLRGEILPPSESLLLPTSLGLHHHADDPEAAGYTISELSILSRSTVPTQRCVAWQVIGRILYRLGKGEFGDPDQDLVEGLWTVIEREAVVPRMMDEAEGGGNRENEPQVVAATGSKSNIGRHASAKAWAVEGIWLWQMGGGKRGILNEPKTGM